MTLGRDIFFDLAGLQSAMFFTDRLGRLFNLLHIFSRSRIPLLSSMLTFFQRWSIDNG